MGSNVEPQANIVLAIKKVLPLSKVCIISRIIQTEPIDMLSDHKFLNLVMYLETEYTPQSLQQAFNTLETGLGRDRSDPLRKVKDRPIDLDIMTEITETDTWRAEVSAAPNFFQPILMELLQALQLLPDLLKVREDLTEVPISLFQQTIGISTIEITKNGLIRPLSHG